MRAYDLASVRQNPSAVRELYLSQHQLTAWPDMLEACINLEVLDLSHNPLPVIPPAIGKLVKLRRLKLASTALTQLPPAITSLVALEEIDISYNALVSWPAELGKLPALKRVLLAGNRIPKLPPEWGQYANQWRELDLQQNQLRKLFPWSPPANAALQILRLNKNRLSVLPEDWSGLPELETLELARNRLASLPAGLSTLVKLRRLDLSGNQLVSVPAVIRQLPSLRELHLANNKLQKGLDTCIHLPWLARLDLQRNNLSSLPEAFAQCARLEVLELDRNTLTALPPLPPKLRHLSLRNNPLQNLDEALTTTTALRYLDIRGTNISLLPQVLLACPHLHTLRVSPPLTDPIPSWFFSLPKLDQFPGNAAALSLLKATRRAAIPTSERHWVAHWFAGETIEFNNCPLATLLRLSGMQRPELRQQLLQFILKKYHSRPPRPGEAVLQVGKPVQAQAPWRQTLNWHTHWDDTITGIVLGSPPYRNIPAALPEKLCIWDEWHLAREENSAPLSLPGAETLRRLLLSTQERDLRLAVQLLQGKQLPDSLLTTLFIAWKNCSSPKLRQQFRQLLIQNLPVASQVALSRKVSLAPGLPAAQRRENVHKIARGTTLDVQELLDWVSQT